MKTRSQARHQGVESASSTSAPPIVTDTKQNGDVDRPGSSSHGPAKKRARTVKHSDAPAPLRRRKRDLSALPTLPLDVLYEIFSHLGPADLLHLTRTTKAFRSVLLSHQSAFVWRDVLDSVNKEDYPDCPEDMSEPAWVNLVWGGPWCNICGARAQKVLWTLRRRLCKSCAYTHLIPIDDDEIEYTDTLLEELEDKGLLWPDACVTKYLPCDYARTTSQRGRKTENIYVLKEDFDLLRRDMEEIRLRLPGRPELKDYLARKKAETDAKHEHALLCNSLEERRQYIRNDELQSLKEQRYDQVRSRLLNEGYLGKDLCHDSVKLHKDVWNSSPLTERVWARVGPIIRNVANTVRDRRLELEKSERLTQRKNLVATEYLTLLRGVAHSSVSFMPSLSNLLKIEPIAAAIQDDVEPSGDLLSLIEDAIDVSLPTIDQWIHGRMESLRGATPASWIRASLNSESDASGVSSTPKLFDVYSAFASYDLAVYVYKCSDASHSRFSPFIGLDAIAHQGSSCTDHQPLVTPVEKGYHAAMQLVTLLGKDPSSTAPADMDQEDAYFLCEECEVSTRTMSWREAVAHADIHDVGDILFHKLNSVETSLLAYAHDRPADASKPVWGCAYCSSHFNNAHRYSSTNIETWFTYYDAETHLLEAHDVGSAIIGRDVFYNRRERSGGDLNANSYHSWPWDLSLPALVAMMLQEPDLATDDGSTEFPSDLSVDEDEGFFF